MKRIVWIVLFISAFSMASAQEISSPKRIRLPDPSVNGEISVEQAIAQRRSVRSYQDGALTMGELSQLLWAAQGITGPQGFRSAPSAGALYPLEVFIAAGEVEDLTPGVYQYIPEGHRLRRVLQKDVRAEIWRNALHQDPIKAAPVSLIFTVVYQRTMQKYGERGRKYTHMEVGHAAQNVYLQCESLNLGTVVIGAFNDREVRELLQLKPNHQPMLIMPVGKQRRRRS